ncbi:MAG: hypothetical protein HW420_1352 [Candidatus Nitrosotenuis sp.]|nr:hypothetical protein [Candidatus Nitrosotenuis sp.]
MARRYLDRNTKERFKKLTRAGEFSSHITEEGPKIQEFDDLAPKRIIFLHDVDSDPKDVSDIVNEKIDELRQTAEETSEYIQLVNNHLDKQKTRIDDLKRMQNTFDTQINFLTPNNTHEKKKARDPRLDLDFS